MFYEKPVANTNVKMAASALLDRMKLKVVTLSQEVTRRLRNTSREAKDKIKEDVMKTFMVKLARSGYHEGKSREIRMVCMVLLLFDNDYI